MPFLKRCSFHAFNCETAFSVSEVLLLQMVFHVQNKQQSNRGAKWKRQNLKHSVLITFPVAFPIYEVQEDNFFPVASTAAEIFCNCDEQTSAVMTFPLTHTRKKEEEEDFKPVCKLPVDLVRILLEFLFQLDFSEGGWCTSTRFLDENRLNYF